MYFYIHKCLGSQGDDKVHVEEQELHVNNGNFYTFGFTVS